MRHRIRALAILLAACRPSPAQPQAPPPAKLPASVVAAAESAEPIECGAEAFKRFTASVQPVLMNACASCHAGQYAGKFHLERTFIGSLNSRPATLRNAAVTLSQIDRTKPAASPLLVRAIAAHGGAALPPLRDRSAPAFKQLDAWVTLALADSTAPPAVEPKTETVSATLPPAPGSTFGADRPKPDAPSGPKDPFDPVIFNRQYHPDKP